MVYFTTKRVMKKTFIFRVFSILKSRLGERGGGDGGGDGRAAPHPAEGRRFRDLGFQQPIVLAPPLPRAWGGILSSLKWNRKVKWGSFWLRWANVGHCHFLSRKFSS